MVLKRLNTLAEITPENWAGIAPPEFPFVSLSFLLSLETTDCLGDRTGWFPVHLTVWDKDGREERDAKLLGALILFLKTNSYGEYIFDFAWANAFHRHGREYYPKLVSAIPFTPATGSKLLTAHTLASDEKMRVQDILLKAAVDLANEIDASSVHLLFVPHAEGRIYDAESAFTLRHSYQFHWRNESYKSFDDFLVRLKSKRRKEIVRERNQVAKHNVQIEKLTGDQLTVEHASMMYNFYLSTVQKMGGYAYLTRDFYLSVFAKMRDQILFVLARNESGEAVAGALNYFGPTTLFGRSWGCLDDYKALHFELCYYQGIEFAIERDLELFEAGAQGEHKLQRGFLPSLTYSAHHIREPQFETAITSFIASEKTEIRSIFEDYAAHSPFASQN